MKKRGVFAVDRGVWDELQCQFGSTDPLGQREAWLWLGLFGPVTYQRNRWRYLAQQWRWSSPVKVRKFLERLCNAGLVKLDDASISAIPLSEARPAAVRPGLKSWRALRQFIFRRDGFACVYCGVLDQLACDHVVPRSRGGKNEVENLVTACRSCNSSKGDRTPEEWRA